MSISKQLLRRISRFLNFSHWPLLIKFIFALWRNRIPKLIISIDFDETIVKPCFPHYGPMRPGAKEVLNWLKNRRHILILNTCRVNDYKDPKYRFALAFAVMGLHGDKFHFDYVNQNVPERVQFWGVDSRKLAVDLDIDDKSLIPWAWWMVPVFVVLREYQKFKAQNR